MEKRERTELFKPMNLTERFTVIRYAKGTVTVDFEMDHLEFSEPGSITETRIENGNYLRVQPDGQEYLQTQHRYRQLMEYMRMPYRKVFLQKFSQEKCFAFETNGGGKLRLDGHVNMLMYAPSDTYNVRIDLSKDIFQEVEPASQHYNDAVESLDACLKLMAVEGW